MIAAAALWILEDDEKLCGPLAEQCERHQWSLRPFQDPRSFEAALEGGLPDLLLLDQLLPGKNGMDVLARLRRSAMASLCSCSPPSGPPPTGLPVWRPERTTPRPSRSTSGNCNCASPVSSAPARPPPPPGTLCIGALRFDPRNLVGRGGGGEEGTLSRGDAALLQAQLNGGRDPIASLRGRGYRLGAEVREPPGEG